ncbi:HNH endonuclease signature motif containing protein [Actinotalea solisilvae]|uniref:HNH endonuclease signature motif containing protein n=1 Tax=Actinotalea solisilvae TaxID=2072922 RepID=UPI0018F1863B|nr:HNH endonuclease signature motif containing protein [Actinotalea solisilvae]
MDGSRVPTGTWGDEWAWSVLHRLASELDASVPSPALVARLDGLEPADVDDAALVEMAAAWERVASWAAAGQARAVQELHRRRRGLHAGTVADELAARLNVTRAAAEGKLGLAVALDTLPEVADALSRGDLDVRRATVLTEDLAHLPADAAREVAAAVLPQARECTAPQLRQRVRRLELVRDPDGAARRHDRARERRRVELQPAPDSMAWLTAYLPADDAVAIHTTLTALVADRAEGDSRSLDARRADALVDLATRWLDAGTAPDGTPLGTAQGRRPHLVLTASALAVAGLTDSPAHLEGYGPVPATLARRIGARATWEPLLVDARTGAPLARSTGRYAPSQGLRDAVVQRDATCTFPGCRMPARRCDVDHIEAYAPDAGGEDQTRLSNLHALCRHHHNLKTRREWTPLRTPSGHTVWSSPHGRPYRRTPEHTPPDRPPSLPPPPGVTVDLGPPPF